MKGNNEFLLSDNVMDMSKINTGQMKIDCKPVCLNSLMAEILSMFQVNPMYRQKIAKHQHVVLRYDIPKEKIVIMSDPKRLKQIFVNLIGNSLKFTEKGFVYFGYSIINTEIVFYVMDSGIGIPANKMQKIFHRFTHADNAIARKYGGLGLGLAISKGLTNLLNGKIWCVSDLGKGSNFYFSIPFRPASMLSVDNTSKGMVA